MEKEKLDKLRRIAFLEMELIVIHKLQSFQRKEINRDFISLQAEEEWELTKLYLELYPETPRDLFEDVKRG